MADNDIQCRSHHGCQRQKIFVKAFASHSGMPETSCRQWWSIQKASLIRSVSSDGPYSCLIPSGWSCAISRHVCGAYCPDPSMWTGSRCRAGMSSLREGTAYKQGVSHQRSCNSHKQLQKQTTAISCNQKLQLHWKLASGRKTKSSSTLCGSPQEVLAKLSVLKRRS